MQASILWFIIILLGLKVCINISSLWLVYNFKRFIYTVELLGVPILGSFLILMTFYELNRL